MDVDALRAAIGADPQARSLAEAGDDAGCAARMRAILPPVVSSAHRAEGAILLILGAADGDAALAAIESTAQAAPPDPRSAFAPVLSRIVRLIQSGAGVDFGEPSVRAMLDQLQAAEILQPSAVAKLKAAAESPASVSADDVSRAWLIHRPGGILGGTD